MSAVTGIEWTDRTWNPVRGCSVISPGCVNCYAMKTAHRFSQPGMTYDGLTKMTKAGPQWTGEVITVEHALLEPLKWKAPQRVFVNSMSDLFHEDVSFEFIKRVWDVMAQAQRHTFQVLTKRPARMLDFTRWVAGADDISIAEWPGNVWLGVSVENQHFADERIPLLLRTPAAVRFISAEPLLGPVDLKSYVANLTTHHLSVDVEGALANRSFDCLSDNGKPLTRSEAEAGLRALVAQGVKRIKSTDECVGFSDQTGCPGHPHPRLDWVICGGESGPGARPCDLAWARAIIQQCLAAGVPVFLKQLGAMPIAGRMPHPDDMFIRLKDRKGGDPEEWPADLRDLRQFPVR